MPEYVSREALRRYMFGMKESIDAGRDVILHCRAGRHRAALAFTFALMYGKGITFQEAREANRETIDQETNRLHK